MNRRYLIINTDELDRVDFNVVAETSTNTVRKSIDQTKTFIKWNYLGISTEGDPVTVGTGVTQALSGRVDIGVATSFSSAGEILPSFVSGVGLSSERVAISTYQGPYSHSEILAILNTDAWTSTEGI